MVFLVDNIHSIGKTHHICQDYTLSGVLTIEDNEVLFLIAADGCSAIEHSDVGSKLLSFSAKKELKALIERRVLDNTDILQSDDINQLGNEILLNAISCCRILECDYQNLFSTVILSFLYKNTVHTILFGDGTYFEVDLTGNITTHTVTYNNNAPYYLYYNSSSKLKNEYLSANYGVMTVDDIEIGQIHYCYITSEADTLSKFGISTDGVSSFVETDSVGAKTLIPINQITPTMLDIKNQSSEFLKARILKMMSRYHKKGIYHEDDLGVALAIRK